MKSLFLSVFLLAGISLFAQKDIKFNKTTHQFGKIKKGVPATFVFTYTNESAKPVVIEFANAECGCTKPVYNQAPTVKGKTSTIKVTYNAESVGVFKKRVDVKFAHSNQPYILTIEGEVVETKK
ncbi:MAG: hypothetical protein C0446_05080 [Chitinophaga sp.]|nr:hypothetical protein [Chitinophaga sp.]PJE45645.1 MAG: hypothetical protein CUR34_12450 [Sediminibacterium sp.] [Sediminibacterium sp. FEMGT703S]